jgi:hypothetical protein
MRRKKEAVVCFECSDERLPKVVRDYRARCRAISQVLDQNPEILDLVHKDLQKLSEGDSRGRVGDYTSESILRALVVQHLEGLPFRDAVNWGSSYQRGKVAGRMPGKSWRNRR